jgi:hypothetical protein
MGQFNESVQPQRAIKVQVDIRFGMLIRNSR